MSLRGSVAGLVHLAQKVVAEAGEACGKQNEFTLQISSLQNVLNRLEQESANPKSGISRASKERKRELEEYIKRCKDILRVLDAVFMKYNSLTDDKKRSRKIWRKVKFVNGETRHLTDIRLELSTLAAAILISVRLNSLKSFGKVDVRLSRLESHSKGRQLQGLRTSLHWITASKAASGGEGSIWTNDANDKEDFWRDIRRRLVKEGYDKTVVKKHNKVIQYYITDLGNRGVFNGLKQEKPQYLCIPSGGWRKDDTSKELNQNGTARSLLSKSTTPIGSPTSSERVQTAIDEKLRHTGDSQVHDISISGNVSSFETVIQPLQSLDLRPMSEPVRSSLDLEFLPNSPTESTFVLSDEIEMTERVPISIRGFVKNDLLLTTKFDMLPEGSCPPELASVFVQDPPHSKPVTSIHSSTQGHTPIASNSQPPSIISSSSKPSSPKQVRFVDSELYSRTAPVSLISRLTTDPQLKSL